MHDYAYIAEAHASSLHSQLLINGWPIYCTSPVPALANVKLNPFLLEGKNELSVRLKKAPASIEPAEPELYTLRLFRAIPDADYTSDRPMLFFRWLEPQHPLGEEWSTVYRHEFEMREAFGRWAWENARAYRPEDRPDIHALVQNVRAAFEERDRERIHELLHTRQEEWGRALGVRHQEMNEDADRLMDLFFAVPDWHMLPVDEEELRMDVGAGGKLVQVMARNPETQDFRPVLQGRAGGMKFEMQVCVSCIDGEWKVVR